jgi:hypothetical protein
MHLRGVRAQIDASFGSPERPALRWLFCISATAQRRKTSSIAIRVCLRTGATSICAHAGNNQVRGCPRVIIRG